MKINWAILTNSIVLNFDGKTKNISIDNKELHAKILGAIKEGRTHDIPDILNVGAKIDVSSNKNIEIRDGYVYIDGDAVVNSISQRIIQYHDAKIPYNGLVEFWRNLKQNPSYRARERLFLFLENGGHPFTDDGHFIAYKAVTKDFKDVRTQTIDNSIGAKPSMDRSEISDDPTVTCAPGLHVASFKYLPSCYASGYTYICVKVNPKDVVSIPIDYSAQKMRVCNYEVISLSESPLTEIHYPEPKPVVDTPIAVDPTVEKESESEESGDSSHQQPPSSSSSDSESSSSSSSSSESSSAESSSSESEEETVTEPEVDENKDSEVDNSNPPGFVSSDADTVVIEYEELESESSSSEEY